MSSRGCRGHASETRSSPICMIWAAVLQSIAEQCHYQCGWEGRSERVVCGVPTRMLGICAVLSLLMGGLKPARVLFADLEKAT